MADQSFCLRWEGFQSNVTSLFEDLRQGDELVDITLCCEGQKIGAHRMMLSACSPYFRDVLKNNPCQHMVFYMKDTSASDLRALVEFMYRGSVNVSQSQLASFIKTAESLQIRGLSGDEEKAPPSSQAARRSTAPAGSQDPAVRSPQILNRRHENRLSVPLPTTSPPVKRRRHTSNDPATGSTHTSSVSNSSSSVGSVIPAAAANSTTAAASTSFVAATADASGSAVASESDHTSTEHSSSAPRPSGALAGGSLPSPGVDGSNSCPEPQSPGAAVAGHSRHTPSQSRLSRNADSPVPLKTEGVKVEKVDLTEDDDEVEEEGSLEATLGQVAEYESFDGSNQGMFGSDFHQQLMSSEYVAGDDMAAGSSQMMAAEDGNSQDKMPPFICQFCGKVYRVYHSLAMHRKMHQGKIICAICNRAYSNVSNLRGHLRISHRLSEEEVWSLVPLDRARFSSEKSN